jgi:hypothetical protein
MDELFELYVQALKDHKQFQFLVVTLLFYLMINQILLLYLVPLNYKLQYFIKNSHSIFYKAKYKSI